MNNSDFILIQGWMVNELGLSGNKLLVYAIIYGFTHGTDEHSYRGGIRYLMKTTGAGRRTIIDNLNSLCEEGLLRKETGTFNNIPYSWYSTALVVQNPHGGSAEIAPKKYIGKDAEECTPTLSRSEYKYSSLDNSGVHKKATQNLDCQLFIDRFNEICKSLPKCMKLTEQRKAAIKARWAEYGAEVFTAFEKAEASDFLTGRNGGWAGADFDWILRPTNIVKILEGNYDNERYKPEVKTTINRIIRASADSEMKHDWTSESMDF